MILSDHSIRQALESRRIQCSPVPTAEQIQPASLDLTLDRHFKKFLEGDTRDVDVRTFDASREMQAWEADELWISPGQFILGSTIERIGLPADLRGCLHGRSSLARLGLVVHVTAGYIDPGFCGNITLELANLGSRKIVVPVGYRVAQISFEKLDTAAAEPYGLKRNSKYQGQTGPMGSLAKKDAEQP